MEEFESQFAELSFKVAKLKVSLRIKRYRTISEDDQNGSEQLDGELNQENVSRRSSISSTDSDFPHHWSDLGSIVSHLTKCQRQRRFPEELQIVLRDTSNQSCNHQLKNNQL